MTKLSYESYYIAHEDVALYQLTHKWNWNLSEVITIDWTIMTDLFIPKLLLSLDMITVDFNNKYCWLIDWR